MRDISAKKNEPEWMLDLRLKGLRLFGRKPMPAWGADLSGIDFDNIKYFVRSTEKQATSWEDLPADIKNTYDRLGIPEAEKQRLVAGVAAQYESEVVYHAIREDLEEQGVLFLDTDTGLKQHEDIFQEYFSTVIPVGDNKFAALNTAVWSGGSFIYVPKGVNVEIPLQAYFRINTENMGQFERTLIIVDEGAYVHYVEGCTAPIYCSDSLHSAVVEIIVKKDARCRYTTIQNWSNNVYNLVTKRAVAHEGATMEWVDGNIGSKVTMKYPAVYMIGEHAKGECSRSRWPVRASTRTRAPRWCTPRRTRRRTIISKSIARGGGRTSYRGLVQVLEGSHHSRSHGEVRRAAGRHDLPLRHLPLRGHSRGRRLDGARGDGLQGERRPAVLPHEPRPHRGRGHGDDRARVHRADRQGTADGVRAGAQPADRDADGGRGRMSSTPRHRSLRSRFREDRRMSTTTLVPPAKLSPPKTRAQALRSYDVADFPALTGREEEWRFTPLKRLRVSQRRTARPRRGRPVRIRCSSDYEYGPLPAGVTISTVDRADARIGRVLVPFDRVSALAFGRARHALHIDVAEGHAGRPRR